MQRNDIDTLMILALSACLGVGVLIGAYLYELLGH